MFFPVMHSWFSVYVGLLFLLLQTKHVRGEYNNRGLNVIMNNAKSWGKVLGKEKGDKGLIHEHKHSQSAAIVASDENGSGRTIGLLRRVLKPFQALPWKRIQQFVKDTSTSRLLAGSAAGLLAWKAIDYQLWKPSRTYDRVANSVGREYDAWTTDGILEQYWGEHIHLGYYSESERNMGYKNKDFIQAKYDFIDEMLRFGNIPKAEGPNNSAVINVLDVGCGIGGTSRYLAQKLGPNVTVTGITLSSKQCDRARMLASDRHISNARFEVMDALNLSYPDNCFDVVWACESGEHMPDKVRYIEEMTRVLKPGGKLIVATWCQRDETTLKPFTASERKMLNFLYAEWTHPYFISINDYAKIMNRTGRLQEIHTADWTQQTIPSWRHSVWVGVWNPWPVLARPRLWWKCVRDGVTLERMHRAFEGGLMQYGMLTATKSST